MHRAAGQHCGQRGGAVPGVEDHQRRAGAAVPGRVQAAQQVAHLPDRLPGAGGGRGPLHVDQRGPGGAQLPECRGELVLPAGDGLAGAVAPAGVMMDMAAPGRALGVRPGVRRGVDREPQPPPPRARVPDLPGCLRGNPGQRVFQQPVVDPVMLADPGAAFLPVHEPRQCLRQQGGELLLIDLTVCQRGVQRAVAAAELRHQRQLHQRRHRMISAQDRVAQLEARVRPGSQALIQPGTELPQPLVRPVPRDRVRDLRRIRRLRPDPGQAPRHREPAQAAGIPDRLRLPAQS